MHASTVASKRARVCAAELRGAGFDVAEAQCVHAELPSSAAYVPAGHSVHSDAWLHSSVSPALNHPAGHCAQAGPEEEPAGVADSWFG